MSSLLSLWNPMGLESGRPLNQIVFITSNCNLSKYKTLVIRAIFVWIQDSKKSC